MKPSQLLKVLEVAIENRHPLLIVGPPGIGKSDIVAQCCAAAGVELLVFHPVISDPTDFKGLPFAHNGEADFLPFGDLKALITASRPTVAFLDDLGQAPASVQAAAMQLLLARRIANHRVSDRITFLAATNRMGDRAGVQGVLEPVKSRFVSIINLAADVDDWLRWAAGAGMPEVLRSFIRFRPTLLSAFAPARSLTNSPTPRTVAFAGTILNSGYGSEVSDEMISGACGEAFLAEFRGFLRARKGLPSVDRILARPKTARVPKKAEQLYALVGAVSCRAEAKNFSRILTYAGRIPAEFAALLIKDCLFYRPELADDPAFREWSVNNDRLVA